MEQPQPSQRPPEPRRQCAFCGYDISAAPVRGEGGTAFCSRRCRDAHEDGQEPFAGRFGFKQFHPGVSALDSLLPRGIPANAFVLLAGRDGIRHRELQTELVWRALERGEPAIMITFVDPPVAVVEHFLTLGWNVLPHLESGALRIIDCFTNRLREDHQTAEQQVGWNAFLRGFLEKTVTTVDDTTNLRSVENQLHSALRELEMVGTGLVTVDSLNEVTIQGGELETEQFLKEVRGDVCSRLFVPIFASTTQTEELTFIADHAYLFDGILDMRRNDELIPETRLKQIGVRKMDGVQYLPHWATYENVDNTGFRTFDPHGDLDGVYGDASTAPPQRR